MYYTEGWQAEAEQILREAGINEIETYREDTYGKEDIFVFTVGERSFSASDLQAFPRTNSYTPTSRVPAIVCYHRSHASQTRPSL